MKYWTIVVLASLFACCKGSEGEKVQQECMPTIDRFFSQLEKTDYAGALNNLITSNPNILASDSDAVDLRKKFSALNEYAGIYRGHSLINKKMIKDDLAAYSYHVKYDKKD